MAPCAHYGERALPPVAVQLRNPALPGRLVRAPDLAMGEGYMDGTLTIDGRRPAGSAGASVCATPRAGRADWWRFPLTRAQRALRVVSQFNPAQRARANVAHHYDLSSSALRSLPRCRPAILLCLFPHARGYAGTGAGPEEGAYRGQAAPPARHARARHRLRLGRHGADAGARPRRACDRRHPVRGTAPHRHAARRATQAWPTASTSA